MSTFQRLSKLLRTDTVPEECVDSWVAPRAVSLPQDVLQVYLGGEVVACRRHVAPRKDLFDAADEFCSPETYRANRAITLARFADGEKEVLEFDPQGHNESLARQWTGKCLRDLSRY